MSLLDQVHQISISEVPEILTRIKHNILSLKEEKNTAKTKEIITSVNSIKSGSSSLGIQGVNQIADKFEDYLKALYHPNLEVDSELESLFLEAYDCLAIPLLAKAEEETFDEQKIKEKADFVWQQLDSKLGQALIEVEDYLPTDDDLEIESVSTADSSEVEVDVNDSTYRFFVDEIPELLQQMEMALLTLKEEKTIAKINEIMRAAHSIKGGAASVGLDGIKNIAHKLEDYVKALFDDSVEIYTELETDLLAAYDCLRNALLQQKETGSYDSQWEDEVNVIWERLEKKLGHISNNDYLPSSEDLGIDVVASMFEVDVKQAIDKLQDARESGQSQALLYELNVQTEVFKGLAEILNLPGFGEIAQTIPLALEKNPDQIEEIADEFIKSVIQARGQVLTGDRTSGGQPSTRLLELATQETDNQSEVSDDNSSTAENLEEVFDIENLEISQEIDSYVESDLQESTIESDFSAQDLELQNQAYSFFIEEAVELLQKIDEGLELVLEQRNINDIHEISRAAHSLKGGARSSGLEDIGNIAFRVEKTFKTLYNEEVAIDEELESYFREIYQTLRRPLRARIDQNECDERAELDTANQIWQALETKLGDKLTEGEEYLPSSSDLGIDIATSIFEVDVAEAINHLTEVVNNPENHNVTQETKDQIEMFTGFGEMLSLSGFVDICQTAQTAIENNPEQVMAIAQCYLENITEAKDAILAGDREKGGQPSAQLLAFAQQQGNGDGENFGGQELPSLEESDDIFADFALQQEETTNYSTTGHESENGNQIQTFEDYEEDPVDTTDQSYGFFIEEAPELLQRIESGLLEIKEKRTTADVHEIMRAAHSIKGGAASVGLEAIKNISHQLEDIFKCLYDDEIEIDTELESWLLEGFDALRNPLVEQIETGSYNPREALANASNIWAKIERRLGDALKRADDYIPSSSDLGVDMVTSIFEVDVEEELERLRKVVSSPDSSPLAGELRATLEVFSGFGEMLNLQGFAEIANLGLIAVERNPDRVLDVIQVIIRDVETARSLVLEGDRDRGGEPSQELRDLAITGSIPTDDQDSLEEVFGVVEDDYTDQILAIEGNFEDDDDSGALTPPLEEIFGDTPDFVSLIADMNVEDEDENYKTPSLSEVFISNFDNQQSNSLESEAKSVDEQENSEEFSLEEAFTAELEEDELKLVDLVHQQALEEDENEQSEDESSLEEVFGAPDLSVLEMEEISDTQTDEEETEPSLEDVFGNEDFVSLTGEIESVEGEIETTDESTPDLEEVFNISEELQTIDENDFSDLQPTGINGLNSLNTSNSFAESKKKQIDSTVKSIGEIFTDLPTVEQESDIQATPPKKNPTNVVPLKPESQKNVANKTKKTSLTVRVDLDRLERINNFIGELSINRNTLSLQNDKLQASVKELIARFSRFNQMAGNLRSMSDSMLIAPEKFGKTESTDKPLNPLIGEDGEIINVDSGFDSLEMDSYGSLYSIVQELIEQMIQLEESVDDIALFAKQSSSTVESQRQMLNNTRDELMWARMLPLGDVLNRFPRVLRDLSVKHNKKVNLKLVGTGVLVDKSALEKLYDPLVHLLRNAFDHGIESQDVRKQQGKAEEGTIQIKAYHQGNQTVIEVQDDGGGLNLEKISRKAIERGLLSSDQLAAINKNNLLNLIFEPGFSTAPKVTDISGRGVGLDIVRSQLQSLKGSINVDSLPNQGTTFTLKLPLTLTIDKLLVLLADTNLYALPSDNIEEILVPTSTDIKFSGDKRFLYYQKELIPIYILKDLLNYNCYLYNSSAMKSVPILPVPEDWGNPILLLRQGQQLFAVEVDRLVSEQELVIKPFAKSMSAPAYTYGCSILGDGSLIPVINGSALLEQFFAKTQPGISFRDTLTSIETDSSTEQLDNSQTLTPYQISSVLVIDDSVAMRRTLALSLEKAGYRVLQAKDGKEALDQLTTNSNINLIICDIEMPNMNGFEFLGQRRRHSDMMKIPVAMLTSRSNDKHRKLATHLGADAYFTKPYIEQKFLNSIHSMIRK